MKYGFVLLQGFEEQLKNKRKRGAGAGATKKDGATSSSTSSSGSKKQAEDDGRLRGFDRGLQVKITIEIRDTVYNQDLRNIDYFDNFK